MDDLLGLDMTFVAFVRKGTLNESVISQLVVFAPLFFRDENYLLTQAVIASYPHRNIF